MRASADPLRASAMARHGRWSTRNPTSSSDDADRARDAQPLAEHDDPDEHRQQRRRPARQRVDDRQVAAPVGRRQQDEVGRLDDPGRDPQRRSPRPAAATWPCAHQTAIPSGTMPTDAASIPIVAARSGSPAVLSRTFQARCRTADTATSAMTQGSTPGRYLPISRRVRPNAQTATPADDHDRRDDDPDRVEDAGHRLAEVLVERQVEDPLGQLERRAQRVEQQRGDRPGRRSRRPPATTRTRPPTASPTPANAGGGEAEDADPGDRRDRRRHPGRRPRSR